MTARAVAMGCALTLALTWPHAVDAQRAVGSSPARLTMTTTARSLQPGELVLVTVTTSAAASAVRVLAFGTWRDAFAIDERTWQAAVGIDLDVRPGPQTFSVTAIMDELPVRGVRRIVVTAKRFSVRRLTVEPKYVEPPADEAQRIVNEARDLAAIFASSDSKPVWTGPFLAPVTERANSAFGSRSIFNGQPRAPHGGADFPSRAGTEVRAPNAGRVVLARDLYFTGNTVIIDHGAGLISLLAHLSEVHVEPGARVEAGDVVGLVGATGRVTGPHLHWAVRAWSARVDPLSLLAAINTSR